MQHCVVDPATCAAVNYCKYATPPITNADRIRAMTDEELADFMIGAAQRGGQPTNSRLIHWLDWLKSDIPN